MRFLAFILWLYAAPPILLFCLWGFWSILADFFPNEKIRKRLSNAHKIVFSDDEDNFLLKFIEKFYPFLK